MWDALRVGNTGFAGSQQLPGSLTCWLLPFRLTSNLPDRHSAWPAPCSVMGMSFIFLLLAFKWASGKYK